MKEIGLSLAVKLGSAIVHADEFIETNHPFDITAFRQCMEDPEVKEWIIAMTKEGFLPVKRSAK